MTTNQNNPFVLPGLGQTGEMASNPLFASLEMMRQTFSALSGTNGLAKGLSMQPTLDPAELEKKINELKSVESWLKLNLSMLSSTIQGMEVQLATITTLQQFMSANAGAPVQATKVWPTHSAERETSTATKQASPVKPDEPTVAASTEAAQAWWNMLTQQFGQLAAATTSSMGAPPADKNSAKEKKDVVSKSARSRATVKKTNTRSGSPSTK